MNWHNELKIALIEKNSTRAYILTQNLPELQNIEEMLEARELISQTIELLESEKQNLKEQMAKIKAAKKFLN